MAYAEHAPSKNFVASHSHEEIAKRIREDAIRIDAGETCSLVAYQLPGRNTADAMAIATYLAPSPDLSGDIKGLIYENLISKIKRHWEDGRGGNYERRSGPTLTWESSTDGDEPDRVTLAELFTALKVLQHLQQSRILEDHTPISTAVSWLEKHVVVPQQPDDAPPPGDGEKKSITNLPTTKKPMPRQPPPPAPPLRRRRHLCYICRLDLAFNHPHPTHPSLCTPCGAFNLASSQLSTPPHLTLPPTFTALVTGARVNLGYHTALRLLRCGARVIATSRYPRDAAARYAREADFGAWGGPNRLRVVGADFRCAADAFTLVGEVRRCLGVGGEWEGGRLDVLVNNAAQTLTDAVRKEERAVRREEELEEEEKEEKVGGSAVLIAGSYKARVRGGAVPMALEGVGKGMIGFGAAQEDVQAAGNAQVAESGQTTAARTSVEAVNGTGAEIEVYTKSSWVQSLFEIPYEDVISAHAVNTFVPLILCRELLPLMGRTNDSPVDSEDQRWRDKPQGYIINVSSREGIFEERPDSTAKAGKHVHTNMSKAALNMITETEAATAWRTRRVAMNTVDPGYMSAAPEYEDAFGGTRPIGWEDGAGRVLWPIAMGEKEGETVWGRFLKHYGAVHVDPGVGSG